MRTLLMLRGAPGCGKSTWIREHGLEQYALSADGIRMLCAGPKLTPDGGWMIDPTNDSAVWKMLFELLEIRMQNGEFTVIDATNSKSTEMNKYKVLCDEYRYRMYCVDMTDIPIETVKGRNAARDVLKRVPESAIDKMYSRFATQKIPSGITVIRPDELDRVFLHKIDLSEYENVHVIGDIHGCATALFEYVTADTINERDFYIFTGDYIDRGIENDRVLDFLLRVKDLPNVMLLEGNHERWLWNWANNRVSQSKEFELVTRTQLENAEIDRKSIRKLYRRMCQCAWFDHNGTEFFVTHAGISTLPSNPSFISTSQMIRGVGSYDDFEAVENAWLRTMPPHCIQIHGHRNTKNLPIRVNEKNYNLEGRVEFGGCLRVVRIAGNDGQSEITPIEIQNTVFRQTEEMFQYKYQAPNQKLSIPDIILEMRKNKYIGEKRFGSISSFNFTKSAFYDKAWNDMTTKARGLYINIPKAKIVARAYDKFFNIGERNETKLENLPSVMEFPVNAYVKENGFLGIAAWNEEENDLFITTKSSPDGDYAQWLREDMKNILGEEKLNRIAEFSKVFNVSFVFECVDIERDPHVIEYPKSRIVLLDIVYNEIPFRKLSYVDLLIVAEDFGLECKKLAYVLESWQEFYDWYRTVTADGYLYKGRHIEGFVVEGFNGFMAKLKLKYYSFWKHLRGLAQETIRNGYLSHAKLASLTDPESNYFYGWLKEYREQLLAANDDPDATVQDIVSVIPRDIVTLRRMFYESETGKQFKE